MSGRLCSILSINYINLFYVWNCYYCNYITRIKRTARSMNSMKFWRLCGSVIHWERRIEEADKNKFTYTEEWNLFNSLNEVQTWFKIRRLMSTWLLTIFGLNGGWTSRFSSFSQSILLKKGWVRTSSSPFKPQPRRFWGCFVRNCSKFISYVSCSSIQFLFILLFFLIQD